MELHQTATERSSLKEVLRSTTEVTEQPPPHTHTVAHTLASPALSASSSCLIRSGFAGSKGANNLVTAF